MKSQKKNQKKTPDNEINKEQTKNLGTYYFEKFQKELHLKEDQELISLFNREVGIIAWVTARASFLAALHKEFEIREFDFSAIGDSKSLSFKNKIWLGKKKRIHIIKAEF